LLALTRLSVAKPLAVIAIFLAVAVAGVLSYGSLPINLLPSVNIPVVTIITTYPGAGPTEVERLVTQVIEEAGLPAVFHTGQTGIGAGLPGGRGIKLRLSNPMLIDDVAADFPGLTVILAHPSVPWQDEAISIATHKANVYIDLSGWSPKYFPPQLVRAASSYLQDKMLFGSDYPLITPDRWLRDFELLDIKPEVRPKILKHNAVRLLGLGG